MKNPNTFLAKDGVSDAGLIRASRDMHKALRSMVLVAEVEFGKPRAAVKFDYAYAALAKAET